jgi:hypothetical protein
MSNSNELREIVIVEFRTPELMSAYEGVGLDTEGLDKVEIIHVVNPLLEEDEKILKPMGWYELEYINQLREQLAKTTGHETN